MFTLLDKLLNYLKLKVLFGDFLEDLTIFYQ